MDSWHWPQWTQAIIGILTLLINAVENGNPRKGNYNFSLAVFAVAMSAWILWAGGFWTPTK